MKLSIAALTLLVIASFTESVEDFEQNLRGMSEIDDEEDGEDADLLDVRSADITDIFQLGKPTWGGSGCPSGTSQVVLSPADIPGQRGVSAMTVIFDAYFAKTSRNRSRDYKSCSLALPVKVKPGFQVAIIKFDYRGNSYVPRGNGYMSRFSAEYFFSGQRGPEASKVFGRNGRGFGQSSPDFGDFTITNNIAAVVWSRCGDATNFRINTSIIAQKPLNGGDDTSIDINTVDAKVKRAYKFRYFVASRRCRN